ncbi:bifunctional 2-polyprenyl-6-hydroxyphenol methylase/3-demethylubiquinol 3-O-methyltransferase UbiG [Paenibacillus sp. L3-i20]|uniref:class I SAM-dependent methyltransferase n=1 Tax=Paenibacillus sp. L3-i20 TaxID=2905833 RepID=UPI001EDD605D|nr:class I SAM-dependent methyltransferase [Paenibacillus sp. L3-i20]GKU75759.1 methyltransferase [Paenibacillus sp. L3-i20]
MKPWYEQSFGSDYMIVYKHRDWNNASQEVRKMAQWLELPEGASILDVGCGMGRHALALNGAGFAVTGLDLSETLLDEAKKHDIEGSVEWVQGDMRQFPFSDSTYDATVNLFTSFGYFSVEEDNVKVLRNIRRVLKEGGSFLIDFLNPNYVANNLVPRSERLDEESGLTIVEVRTIVDGWVQKEITVSESNDTERTRQYLERVRLLPLEWFEQHLVKEGLGLAVVYGNYDGSAYDREHSPRMIMVGKAQ